MDTEPFSARSILLSDIRNGLLAHLDGVGEESLSHAYNLGRRAMADGLGVLDVADLQFGALLDILERRASEGSISASAIVRKASLFLIESLAPFEMTHRGYQDANTALRRVNEMLEEEARRIAHALHDESGQILAIAQITLDRKIESLPAESRQELKEIKMLLKVLEEQMRQLSHELRPTVLDDLGLDPALEFLASGISKRTGLRVVVESENASRLPAHVEVVLYRIAQEALTNVLKHAGATMVVIRVERRGNQVRFTIKDNGMGFDVEAVLGESRRRGLGLVGVQERLNPLGASLTFESAPGVGTELRIQIPLPEEPHAGANPTR